MITYIDSILNKITMYRLVIYYLGGLLGISVVLSFFKVLPYSGFAILVSTIVLIVVSFVTNRLFSYVFEAPINDDSVYITALILALIINPATTFNGFVFLFWAGVLAIASKYIITWKRKHFFNPAAIAVFITSLAIGQSASWWIGNGAMMIFVIIGGLLVVRKIRRFDLVLSCVLVFFVTVIAFNIPREVGIWETIYKASLHAPIFFFAFVMLTEPATTPSTSYRRMGYGAFVGFFFAPQVHILSYAFTPESTLLLGNIFSYILSPTKKMVLRLKEKVKVAANTYDFVFGLDKPMAFAAGQYMEWTLGHTEPDTRGVRRYFTIASSPTKPELRIGIRFADKSSSFKKELLDLPTGGTIVAAGLAGDFTLSKNVSQKVVFIAGGIGITPFRSMIEEMLLTREKRNVIILYSNRQVEHIAYTELLEKAGKELGAKIIYTLSDKEKVPKGWPGEVGFISEKMIMDKIPDYKERLFYISGPESLVSGMKKVLLKLDISRKKIKTDYFPGF